MIERCQFGFRAETFAFEEDQPGTGNPMNVLGLIARKAEKNPGRKYRSGEQQ